MATVIRKAVPADAQTIADIFNGFVTRHSVLGVKPSWTAASVLQNITGENGFALVMEVDGKVQASYLLFRDLGGPVVRGIAASWTLALETMRPDPQFVFVGWLAEHRAEFGVTDLESVWYPNNPFGPLIARADAAGLFLPKVGTGTYRVEITTDGGIVRMIVALEDYLRWWNERKTTVKFWTGLYAV
jgi:hypothetical protein